MRYAMFGDQPSRATADYITRRSRAYRKCSIFVLRRPESGYSGVMTTNGPRVPALTIGELIKVGLPAVVVRCLHPLCRSETLVALASFPVEMHETDQRLIDWACTHCGRAQVVIEQPAARHGRYRPITLGEMRQAVSDGAEAYVPCRPRQVVIEDGVVVRPRAEDPLSSYRRRF